MVRRTILAVTVAASMLSSAAIAQENATFVMRSGETVAGQLVDLGGVGFTVKINGQERQVPANDVSAISFTGQALTDADWARLAAGTQVVVLRSGQTVNGQIYDVSGTNPLKITFRTDGGEREFSSAEIGQILLSRPTSSSSSAAATSTNGQAVLAPASGNGILVAGNRQWTPTGIRVRQGDSYNVASSGEIQMSVDANDVAKPAGSSLQRYAANAPMPKTLAGALIGRVGPNGTPFWIGDLSSLQMPATGELYLGVNDDGMGDNRGEFRVELNAARRR